MQLTSVRVNSLDREGRRRGEGVLCVEFDRHDGGLEDWFQGTVCGCSVRDLESGRKR